MNRMASVVVGGIRGVGVGGIRGSSTEQPAEGTQSLHSLCESYPVQTDFAACNKLEYVLLIKRKMSVRCKIRGFTFTISRLSMS
jgi:hypothetical protein